MLKKAMIMAAGVGSRLGVITSVVPKPLVPVANIPCMDILIKHLFAFGIDKIIANTHYKADMIESWYEKNKNITFLREEELSGTAGGLKKCQFFFEEGEDFAVMSGDGLSDVDLEKVYESHKKSGAIATIVLKEAEESEVSKFGITVQDKDGYVKAFFEKPLPCETDSRLANTGIYIFGYKIFDYIPANTFYDFAKNVFPKLLSSGEKINTYVHNGYWSDIGSVEQYKQSNIDVLNGRVKSIDLSCGENRHIFESNIKSGNNFKISNSVIGKNFKAGDNCRVINSVIWDDVVIGDGATIENSVILSGSIISSSIKNSIIEPEREKITV